MFTFSSIWSNVLRSGVVFPKISSLLLFAWILWHSIGSTEKQSTSFPNICLKILRETTTLFFFWSLNYSFNMKGLSFVKPKSERGAGCHVLDDCHWWAHVIHLKRTTRLAKLREKRQVSEDQGCPSSSTTVHRSVLTLHWWVTSTLCRGCMTCFSLWAAAGNLKLPQICSWHSQKARDCKVAIPLVGFWAERWKKCVRNCNPNARIV